MTTGSLTEALEDTLGVFEGSGTPRTTSEVAAALDLGRRSTYDRLERLVDYGHLETKKVGASARVWWRPRSTGRACRQRELAARVRQQEAAAALGRRALEGCEVDDLMTEAVGRVVDVLDTDYCAVLDFDADTDEFQLRQGVGWDEGVVGTATVSAGATDSQAAYTLASRDPVVVEDLATETRFSGPDLLTSHGVCSGISVVIGPDDDPWGIFGTHATDPRTFADHDVTFVQSVATILASVIERRRDERALLVQRERLAALANLNRTVHRIIDAVVDRSTREEIERTVCEHLAATDSYEFAWIGDVDVATDAVDLRTEAGIEGYLDGITISVDPDDERSQGPTGRALLTGEMQTTEDIGAADDHDPWRDHVEEHDFGSSSAIPIVHGDSTYGVLNVYADRPNSFVGEERAVLGQLGEVVGHAIAAAERKQALMSDELVELEFLVRDIFAALDLTDDAGGTITLDHAVPVDDEEFLVYGTATPDATDALAGLVAGLSHWDSLTVGEDGDPVDVRIRLSDSPILSAVASCGGYVDEAVIEDGDYRVTVHLAPSVEVRRIIDAVEATYPTAELLSRRQIDRAGDGHREVQRWLGTDLTDRQQAALEAAYHAGFFEWPRDVDGGDIADSLDIASPTFHQHLRKAEKRVFESLFGAFPPT